MANIPPASLGSIIQTSAAESRVGAHKARVAAADAERAGAAGFAKNLHEVIEAADRDSQVFSDAEGNGHEGTPFGRHEEDQPPDDTDNPQPAGGLDIEA